MSTKTEEDYIKQGKPYGFINIKNPKWGKVRYGYQPRYLRKVVPMHVVWKVELEKTYRHNLIWMRKIENRVQAVVRVGEYRDFRYELYTYYIKENIATISDLKLNRNYEPYGFEENLRKHKRTLTHNTEGYFIKTRNGLIYKVLNPGVISYSWSKVTTLLGYLRE